jgi:hypothetical protein
MEMDIFYSLANPEASIRGMRSLWDSGSGSVESMEFITGDFNPF